MRIFASFSDAINGVAEQIRHGSVSVHTDTWQGTAISQLKEAEMREVFGVSFQVPMPGIILNDYRDDIQPNLPWADDHFLERVNGVPLNPGEEWKNWPWSLSADNFRTEGELFTHTYMERYWPCYAGQELEKTFSPLTRNRGYRYEYGDLSDVVALLRRDPYTRQAFLPIWFPEDTGVRHGGRVPCTLGYHFLLRGTFLHMTYYIRSCDFYRHFRDDLYLTARLLLWVLDQLRPHDPWKQVMPGFFVFHCVSMHLFINDYRRLFG